MVSRAFQHLFELLLAGKKGSNGPLVALK